ncbi:hypothetical protein TrCOL_g8147 [Triparma columacea]|uniref:Uncharacterized protein n=1 Tax=Triparma columacea TaxID=722753 RepID=A0A9W7G1Q1_9STRA|nr:hypothetical protein TrCOL_g8147 [Triparma columacea]
MMKLKKQLNYTCELLKREVEEGECVTEIREECVIDQTTLMACEKACEMIEQTDLYVSRVLSVGNKTGVWDAVEFEVTEDEFKCHGESGSVIMEGDVDAYSRFKEFLKEERGGDREPDEVEMVAVADGGGGEVAGRTYVKMKGGGKGVMYGCVIK